MALSTMNLIIRPAIEKMVEFPTFLETECNYCRRSIRIILEESNNRYGGNIYIRFLLENMGGLAFEWIEEK